MSALTPWGEGFVAGITVGVLVVFTLLFVASVLVGAWVESGGEE